MIEPASKLLYSLVQEWKLWAKNANQAEDGWQALFPKWSAIISTAARLMEQLVVSEADYKLIEFCWLLSEEDEEMVDYARAHLKECWSIILRLAHSPYPAVRWQAYEVLGSAGKSAEEILRLCLNDENQYCKRRAILSLARLHPRDAEDIAKRFENDPDPYIRAASKTLLA